MGTTLDSPVPPATPCFPPSYILPIASTSKLVDFPLPNHLATPHLRQSFPFSQLESRQHALESRLPGIVPTSTTTGRTQTKSRHSASTLLSLRHSEQHAPSWFESNYTVLSSLGNGEFSDAFEVADRERGGVYAVKRTKHAFGGPKDRSVP